MTRVAIALPSASRWLAPSTNHSAIGCCEVLLALLPGPRTPAWPTSWRNTAVAVVGNVTGDLDLVAFVRSTQGGT